MKTLVSNPTQAKLPRRSLQLNVAKFCCSLGKSAQSNSVKLVGILLRMNSFRMRD